MTYEIKARLTENEMSVFQEMARHNCRKPNQHARYIILKSLGLVTDDGPGLKMNNRHAVTLTETTSKAVGEIYP
jgi:hypothetical protein